SLPASASEIHYQGGGAPPVDVLWVVDDSGSMADEQQKLATNFESFIHYFVDLHLDFHMGITTTDTLQTATTEGNTTYQPGPQGAFVGNPALLTSATQNLTGDFQANVNVGINGWRVERGLEAARMALSPAMLNGANAGFLRPNAVLAIILVSDEDDQSVADNSIQPPSGSAAGDADNYAWRQAHLEDVQDFINFFLSVKNNNPAMVNVSAITGVDPTTLLPPPGDDTVTGCDTSNQANGDTADSGARYYEVAKALHGVVGSICAPSFGPVLDQIGGAVTGFATAYPLGYTPVEGTITVKVDGQVVPEGPNGWTYNATTNQIEFAPSAVPPQCAVIEIDYTVKDFGNGITTGNNELPPAQCGVTNVPQAGNSLQGGAFSCNVHATRGAVSLGSLLTAFGLGLAWALRRRR
ncbi:MAG TPA: hypothetical protein VMV18_09725, partial [bacterium]|nr:hypothetical protein [bacterium]